MYTCCPECSSVFRISAALLMEAGGKARCGECRHVFDVFDALYDELADVRAVLALPHYQHVDAGDAAHTDAGVVSGEEDPPAATAMPAYAAGHWQQQSLGTRDVLHAAAVVLLSLTLAGQWLWFHREALAGDAYWRPHIAQLCQLVECRLPLLADVDKLVLLSRTVQRHPDMPGALLINAEFENQAGFAQRFPVFEVSFTDQAGAAVAMRRFQPAEYLPADADINTGLASGAHVAVRLEVLDPGENASSFQFDFL